MSKRVRGILQPARGTCITFLPGGSAPRTAGNPEKNIFSSLLWLQMCRSMGIGLNYLNIIKTNSMGQLVVHP